MYDYPGRFKGAHGQNFARWQMDGWRNNAEVARGTSRSPEIWPGRRIVLTGHPQANLNREWQVVASELHGEQPQAVPGRSGSGTTLNNHFAVIPADRTWRPQPLLKPLVDGPQSAVVTGPAGEEIFCDEHGRVRVKFNWDRYNPSNQDSSCWIRVAQAWAGTGFGNLAIPRVGQEVIVDFLNGDPDQPIIMGRTYHQENRTPGNRIAEDAHYVYRHDEYGRLAEKTDRIPEGVIRMHDERTHHYHYDSQHRLVFYTRIQHGEPQVESRYLYDPLGRRTGKRVWRRERDLTGWMSLSRKPEVTWYGWDGDRLTTIQTGTTRIQTVYQPGSFTPLLRIETENGEQAKARHRSLAEVLQEDTGVTLPAELSVMLGRLERELRAGAVSAESEAWLAQCGLTAEQMAAQMEAEYIPERKLHLYHCDHRGLPQALISPEGETAWQGEYDEWGNLLGETSAQHLQQSLRLPGQQYDEESGLYYNRNRYYDPLQGRYITQDPIGLRGEWNLYKYPLNPVRFIDSLGLKFHVNGDPSDFNQAVEYLKQDSQMKETIDFLSSSEETINIEYIEGTNVRFNSNNMTIYWNSRASLFCSTELNSKSQSPALGLGHEFAHAQYYLLDKENFMALLSRTDKKYKNKEEARVITIIESRAAKTLGECTRGAHSGLPFYRVDGPLQTMKITGTPE